MNHKPGIPLLASAETRQQTGPSFDNYHLCISEAKHCLSSAPFEAANE